MPVPPFNEHGYLPPGVHHCTMAEIEERFARFQRTDRRIRLFEKLKALVQNLKLSGKAIGIVVDGSFATAKDEPEDIDLVVILRPDHDYGADLRPFEYNAITKAGAKRAYRFDLFAYPDGTEDCVRHIEFFQRTRERVDLNKGVLKVLL